MSVEGSADRGGSCVDGRSAKRISCARNMPTSAFFVGVIWERRRVGVVIGGVS